MGDGNAGPGKLALAAAASGLTVVIAAWITAGESARVEIALWATLAVIASVLAGLLVERRLARRLGEVHGEVRRIGREGDLETSEPAGPTGAATILQAVRDAHGRVDEQLTVAADEREARDAVLATIETGVLLVGSDDAVIYRNTAAEELLGPLPGRATAIVPSGIARIATTSRRTATVISEDLETGRPSRILHVAAVPMGAGRTLVTVADVTAARRLAEVRRAFVADASHELKTPIAAVRAAAETLQLAIDRDPDAARQFADDLVGQTERLARIVDDMLDLSRLEAEGLVAESLDFGELVRKETKLLDATAHEAGVSMEVEAPPVQIVGSSRDLAAAVRNLVVNAIQHTESGDRIDITVDESDRAVRLSVRDTGRGIPTRDIPRIFERFYRVDSARSRATGGTGLGLSIVKHVAERHGGTVAVTSELGRGSEFVMQLPKSLDGAPTT